MTTYKASELTIVNNNTREFEGGYSVELSDGSIVAGPFAAKVDAIEAKRQLVAGETLTRTWG